MFPYLQDENSIISECRVRYLSFMGIGQNVKLCGFIMHTAQDLFIAHVFHCEPSSGALCKTIEAACKVSCSAERVAKYLKYLTVRTCINLVLLPLQLRYQKCLDAHPQGLARSQSGAQTPGKTIGAALKSLVGSLTGRKGKGSES